MFVLVMGVLTEGIGVGVVDPEPSADLGGLAASFQHEGYGLPDAGIGQSQLEAFVRPGEVVSFHT